MRSAFTRATGFAGSHLLDHLLDFEGTVAAWGNSQGRPVPAATQGALVATPPGARPASTASALVSVKTAPFGLGPGEDNGFTVSCDPGQRALGGGFSSNFALLPIASFPFNDGTGRSWHMRVLNLDDTNPATGNAYATCLR